MNYIHQDDTKLSFIGNHLNETQDQKILLESTTLNINLGTFDMIYVRERKLFLHKKIIFQNLFIRTINFYHFKHAY